MRRCCPSREAAERDQPRASALGLISIGKDKPVAAAERFSLPPLWGCDIDEQESPSAYALGYFLTPLRGSGQHARIMLQKIRVPSGFVLATAVLYFAEPTGASILLGLPVALIGGVFRALAAGVIKKDKVMTTGGVYARTRNPLYFGSALLACGFAIISWNEIAAILLLFPFGVIYPSVIMREEKHLEHLFPDEFRAYRERVPRFFPRLSGGSPSSFSFDRYLDNREYNTALGFAGALIVLTLKYWLLRAPN